MSGDRPRGSTGNAFADLLTGRNNSYNESTQNVLHNLGYNIFEGYVQDSHKIKPRLTLEYGLRISHLGGWYDRQGIGIAVFDPSLYNPNASLDALSGLTWNARNGDIPLSGNSVKSLFFAPRVGFAWDLQGTGQTVMRGGYGIFNYHDEQGPFSGMLDVPAGYRSTTINGVLLSNIPSISPGAARIDANAIALDDDQQPRTQS